MDSHLTREVWSRLRAGKPLDDLGLPLSAGRFDLRGIAAPDPSVLKRQTKVPDVTELGDLIVIRDARWSGVDMSKSHLKSLRFHDSTIENCCFDLAKCQDWRAWGTTFVDTAFRGADLRMAALGAVTDRKRNKYHRVDFSRADLRQTVHMSADFEECTFADTKLAKVDFQGDVFRDCTFSGELTEVLFYRHAFRGEKLPPNEMLGVDFRRAHLKWVSFRELDMNDVKWPEGDTHILIHDYRASLNHALGILKTRSDDVSRRLTAVVSMMLKWAGQHQKVGVMSKSDLIEMGGETAVADFERLVTRGAT